MRSGPERRRKAASAREFQEKLKNFPKTRRGCRADSAAMSTQEPPGSANKAAPAPSFPQSNAFVLQFAADAGLETGLFHGRVQHVTSGVQLSFQSIDELWAFVRGVLLGAIDGPSTLSAVLDEDC
jgi:hypothetical protein